MLGRSGSCGWRCGCLDAFSMVTAFLSFLFCMRAECILLAKAQGQDNGQQLVAVVLFDFCCSSATATRSTITAAAVTAAAAAAQFWQVLSCPGTHYASCHLFSHNGHYGCSIMPGIRTMSRAERRSIPPTNIAPLGHTDPARTLPAA